jgi:hypothetical protein
VNRSHAAKGAFDVTIKFFIIGLVTWGVSNNLSYLRLYWPVLLEYVRVKPITSVQKNVLFHPIAARGSVV